MTLADRYLAVLLNQLAYNRLDFSPSLPAAPHWSSLAALWVFRCVCACACVCTWWPRQPPALWRSAAEPSGRTGWCSLEPATDRQRGTSAHRQHTNVYWCFTEVRDISYTLLQLEFTGSYRFQKFNTPLKQAIFPHVAEVMIFFNFPLKWAWGNGECIPVKSNELCAHNYYW
jgi:hypothetical protein